MFKGSIVALVTPFDKNHHVDFATLAKLIEWHLQEGTDGFVIGGTTGEGVALTDDEQKQVLKFCSDVIAKRAPLIMGTGTPSTASTVHKTEAAKAMGADGCLVIVPYCNTPTARGCYQHFQEVSKVGLPMIIYHHPGRTGVRLSLEMLKELSQLDAVKAIKDSSNDIIFATALIEAINIPVLSGDDMLTYPMLQRGAQGTVSVIANMIPGPWSKLVKSVVERDDHQALLLHKKFQKLNEALSLETNPQGIKYAMHLMGKSSPFLRLPLVEPTEETKDAIKDAMKVLNFV